MMKIERRTLFATAAISVAVALVAIMAYPAYAASTQTDYMYALNQENWTLTEEYTGDSDTAFATGRMITIEAKGYAFLRIDEETLKQYDVTTSLIIVVQPASENTERNVDITGSIKVNGETYTIRSGKIVLKAEKKLMFIIGQGAGENGNEITMKLGARYFWWGGKAYAFRSAALLQTAEGQMLLLQRGIAKIQ